MFQVAKMRPLLLLALAVVAAAFPAVLTAAAPPVQPPGDGDTEVCFYCQDGGPSGWGARLWHCAGVTDGVGHSYCHKEYWGPALGDFCYEDGNWCWVISVWG